MASGMASRVRSGCSIKFSIEDDGIEQYHDNREKEKHNRVVVFYLDSYAACMKNSNSGNGARK
jgi:hypothetical protein